MLVAVKIKSLFYKELGFLRKEYKTENHSQLLNMVKCLYNNAEAIHAITIVTDSGTKISLNGKGVK